MRTRGAVIRQSPGKYEVVDLELDDPRPGEIQVRLAASGLCHSDDHLATGDLDAGIYPFAGGHEGSGVVTAVGPNTEGFAEGDHVVLAVPGCGRCRWCASGQQNLCDLGQYTLAGCRFDDPNAYRLSLDGAPVGQMCGISTFCEHTTVSVHSAVRIDPDLPLDVAALVGCGVATGWGSATVAAGIAPGDTVIVVGIGGIGINAVQGARYVGAVNVIAVDPVAFKRESAQQLGATHTTETIEEAAELARQSTNGQGADSAIVTVGVTTGDHVAQAFAAIRKAGTVVVTGLGDHHAVGVPIPISELTLFQKRLQGSLFGSSSPALSIPRLLELYRGGALKLDELITTRYTLDDVARGYEDMHAGRNIRGLIDYGSAGAVS
jgi:S-(hydroxymethyl)glutathione dehydrogenase/alcohol dehydrogenase